MVEICRDLEITGLTQSRTQMCVVGVQHRGTLWAVPRECPGLRDRLNIWDLTCTSHEAELNFLHPEIPAPIFPALANGTSPSWKHWELSLAPTPHRHSWPNSAIVGPLRMGGIAVTLADDTHKPALYLLLSHLLLPLHHTSQGCGQTVTSTAFRTECELLPARPTAPRHQVVPHLLCLSPAGLPSPLTCVVLSSCDSTPTFLQPL